MASPKGHILYKIYYKDHVAYLGRTNQSLQDRLRGHFFAKAMHKTVNINLVTKIEYAECKTTADMYLYEVYYINKLKPPINRDDKATDGLTIELPELEWKEFECKLMDKWKEELRIKNEPARSWKKRREDRLIRGWGLEDLLE